MESQESPPSPPAELSAREVGPAQLPGWRRRGRLVGILVAAVAMLAGATVVAYAVTIKPVTYSLFATAKVSDVPVNSDGRMVELGLTFTSQKAGMLTAVRVLVPPDDKQPHRVTVWSDNAQKLATATGSGESKSGWQQVELTTPVHLTAGQKYVVSYQATNYRASPGYFTGHSVDSGPLSTTGPGIFAYGDGGFPKQVWQAANYWVDVVFTPQAGTKTAKTQDAAGRVGLDLPRVPWEGGPAYYQQFTEAAASGFTDPNYFPIGVWFESVLTDADVAKDKSAGLNLYVELTDNSDASIVRRTGMRAVTSSQLSGHGTETVGWLIADEADMWGGAGQGKWTGKWPGHGTICASKDPCGYDALRQIATKLPTDTRMRYANFGKGVMFWQTDQQAAAFVNQGLNLVSSDIYWYTDPYVCKAPAEGLGMGVPTASCRRAANYGRTMDRIRLLDGLDGKRQPVYGFVEVGHPFAEADSLSITGEQAAGAAMNSLIHEARGLIYFNHNFGGPCLSQHVLREGCGDAVRPAVTQLNQQVTSLAPVLNTQSYQWEFNPRVDTMLKAYDGSYYIFAMPGRDGGTGAQTLNLPPGLLGTSAQVMAENRTIPVVNGEITDTFANEFSYHIYKITP